MDMLFDGLFGAMEAWSSIVLFVVAIPCLLIGGLLIADWARWRFFSIKTRARIHSVRVKNKRTSARSGDDNITEGIDDDDRVVQKRQHQSVFRRSDIRRRVREGVDSGGLSSDDSDKSVIKNTRKLQILFIAVPLILFFTGLYFTYNYASLKMGGVLTRGYVTGYETKYDSDGVESYNLVVRYRDNSGRVYKQTDHISGTVGIKKKVHEDIGVLYDPDAPEKFIIDDFWHNMLPAILFMGFSSVFILAVSAVFAQQGTGKSGNMGKGSGERYSGEIYYPVYEYRDGAGQTLISMAGSGSSSLLNKIPGRQATIYMNKHDSHKIGTASLLWLSIGLVFAAPGIGLVFLGIKNIEFSIFTVLIVLFFLGMPVVRFLRFYHSGKFKQIREQMKEKQEQMKVSPGLKGKELSHEEIDSRLAYQVKVARWSNMIGIVLALSMLVGGYLWADHQHSFEKNAGVATGTVMEIIQKKNTSSDSGSHYNYYPKVMFRLPEGGRYTFVDKVGSSIKMHKIQDQVTVYYNLSNPNDATIDRGVFNFIPQALLGLVGIFILLVSLSQALQARSLYNHRYRH